MVFRSPLTVVLQVRVRAEEREEALLQQILAEIAKTAKSVEEIDRSLASVHEKRAASRSSALAIELCSVYGEIELLKRQRSAFQEHIGKLEQLRDKQMDAYRAARQDRETLEQLLEEQRTAHELLAEKREQASANDIAVGQHFRRKMAASRR